MTRPAALDAMYRGRVFDAETIELCVGGHAHETNGSSHVQWRGLCTRPHRSSNREHRL